MLFNFFIFSVLGKSGLLQEKGMKATDKPAEGHSVLWFKKKQGKTLLSKQLQLALKRKHS